MQRYVSVNVGNVVLSLSEAMDLATPLLATHQQRTAFVTAELCKAAALSDKRAEDVFIAALLHDVGAFSLEEKIALHNAEITNTDEHCIRGKQLLLSVPWLRDAAAIVRFHHTPWEFWEEPIDSPLVFDSQIVLLSDYLERSIDRGKYILHQHEQIISRMQSLSGSSVHPQIMDLFLQVCDREEFWLDLCSPRLYSILFNHGPITKKEIRLTELSPVAELFRSVIDFRSPFTATHSTGVAVTAVMLAKMFRLTEFETNLMEIAGSLHDTGKLAIPSRILNKRGGLTAKEMALMKSHAYHTYSIIRTMGGAGQLAEWAAYHHERLDGSGYPFHCKADDLSTGARIMAVADVFTALSEDRPHREGLSKQGIIGILNQFSRDRLLDAGIVDLLIRNFDEIVWGVMEKQTMARDFYEGQTLLDEI